MLSCGRRNFCPDSCRKAHVVWRASCSRVRARSTEPYFLIKYWRDGLFSTLRRPTRRAQVTRTIRSATAAAVTTTLEAQASAGTHCSLERYHGAARAEGIARDWPDADWLLLMRRKAARLAPGRLAPCPVVSSTPRRPCVAATYLPGEQPRRAKPSFRQATSRALPHRLWQITCRDRSWRPSLLRRRRATACSSW